jgi:hypothetical protein
MYTHKNGYKSWHIGQVWKVCVVIIYIIYWRIYCILRAFFQSRRLSLCDKFKKIITGITGIFSINPRAIARAAALAPKFLFRKYKALS